MIPDVSEGPLISLPLNRPDETGMDWLARLAGRHGDRTAVVMEGRGTITFGRFYADALRFHHGIARLGIGPGMVVALSHADPYVHWLMILACESLGAASTWIPPDRDDARRLSPALDLMVGDHIPAGPDGVRQLALPPGWADEVFAQPAAPVPPSPFSTDPDAVRRVVWTSGTTGRPKGVMLSHAAQTWRIAHMAETMGMTAASTYLSVHAIAINSVLTRAEACLRLGGRVALFSVARRPWMAGGTHLWCLPGSIDALVQSPVPGTGTGLRYMVAGGGRVTKAQRRAVQDVLGTRLVVGYGANEVGSAICLVDEDDVAGPLGGIDARIIGPDGRPVAPGGEGLVAMRNPGMALGYLGDAEATKAAFRGGWFITSDMARALGGDRFTLLGRADDMMVLGGMKVAPLSIETLILDHVPQVAEVGVVGLPDPTGSDKVHVAVVPSPGVDAATARDAVAAILPPWLGGFIFAPVSGLPRTGNGKLRRAELRDMFRKAVAGRPE